MGRLKGCRIRAAHNGDEKAFDRLAEIGRRHHGAVAPRFNPRKACSLHRGNKGNAKRSSDAGKPVVQNPDQHKEGDFDQKLMGAGVGARERDEASRP